MSTKVTFVSRQIRIFTPISRHWRMQEMDDDNLHHIKDDIAQVRAKEILGKGVVRQRHSVSRHTQPEAIRGSEEAVLKRQ